MISNNVAISFQYYNDVVVDDEHIMNLSPTLKKIYGEK
jgi:hypothetical protein